MSQILFDTWLRFGQKRTCDDILVYFNNIIFLCYKDTRQLQFDTRTKALMLKENKYIWFQNGYN